MTTLNRLCFDYWVGKAIHLYLRAHISPPSEIESLPGYLHPLEGRFLHWLAGSIKPGGQVLEVGSFKGKSSSYIASGLHAPGATLHCVDVWVNKAMPYDTPEDVLPQFEANLIPYRGRIDIHRGGSEQTAVGWHTPLDLLFIDGDHSYEGCSTDIDAWLPHVKRGGYVAFHDAGQSGVTRALRERFPRTARSHGVYVWSIFVARKR